MTESNRLRGVTDGRGAGPAKIVARFNGIADASLEWGLTSPGDCPTIFVSHKRAQGGVLVRWSWTSSGGFPPDCAELFGDGDCEDAFHDCLDILRDRFGQCPAGIRIFADDATALRRQGLCLCGRSLGLAFLVGALCFMRGQRWPEGLLCWGSLLLARDGGYHLGPTAEPREKMLFAWRMCARRLLRVRGENTAAIDGIDCIDLASDMRRSLDRIEQLLSEET
jgi:hypothetical protein